MRKYIDGNMQFTVNINTKLLRYMYFAFTAAVLMMGILTLNYDEKIFPLHIPIGLLGISAAVVSLLVGFYIVKNARLAYIVTSTAIIARPFALLSRLVTQENPNVVGSWVSVFTYGAFWLAYTMLWMFLLEPYTKYRIAMHTMLEKEEKNLNLATPVE